MTIPFLKALSRKIPKASRNESVLHPRRDWLVLLGVTLIALLILSAWSYFVFSREVQEASMQNMAASEEKKGVSLEDIRGIFAEREERRAEYANASTSKFIDPSRY